MFNTTHNPFRPHTSFQGFLFFNGREGYTFCNHLKLWQQWVVTYNLLTNIFDCFCEILLFTTKTFKAEVSAYNWAHSKVDYNLFRKTSPYFFLEDTPYGHLADTTFWELSEASVFLTFLTNVTYHQKNLYYLMRYGNYTIGVTSISSSPWTISYPIPVLNNTLLSEYFFIRLLAYMRQKAFLNQFKELAKIWNSI